jgi:arylsulfatase A-like enzyme
MLPRREFLKTAGAVAGAVVAGGCGSSSEEALFTPPNTPNGTRPNILLVLVDQMRLPPDGYGPNQGEAAGVREILRFEKQLSPNNSYARFFPALLRLRRNAVAMRRHYIAATACAPSRTTFLTGQYPSLHKVDQVDGLFKGADEVQFLDPTGVPTIGDWFGAAGYQSYYFGKWHVSHVEQPYDLSPWGFSGWQTSGPEPHGSDPNNLGAHRDPGFADIVSDFLQRKGSEPAGSPWFAVASLVNPHDIAAYPFPFFFPGQGGVTQLTAPLNLPQLIPPQGRVSNPNDRGATVELNPDGFPQDCFELPPTFFEDLSSKPACHLEAAWKVQTALASLFPQQAQGILPYPTQNLGALQEQWARRYGQFYVYLQYLVDRELNQIFQAFDASGLANNTIVVFTSDHGEYGMAHGQMLQKWYTAYEEAVRVPFIVSSPLVNPNPNQMLEVNQPTSHIDLAPTLLGLAGFGAAQVRELKQNLTGHTQVRDFVGLNLAPLLASGGNLPRPGVLFMTQDDATRLPQGVANPEKQGQYDSFLGNVQSLVQGGAPLQPGPVMEPNSVHMLCTGSWKLNRYYDTGGNNPDQWELYHLSSDPNETFNLLDFASGQLRAGATVPGLTTAELQAQVATLKQQLAQQEAQLLLQPA